jgi:cold shock CspA family protein
MQAPAEIAFQRCEPSEAVRSEIAKQVSRLEKFSQRITSCRVVIAGPAARRRRGDLFKVNLHIAMPEHHDVVVAKSQGEVHEHEYPLVAIRDAFDAAVRQVEDVMRALRGEVKAHALQARGRVTKFLPEDNYGFIETPDGREVYFHRNAVLGGAFDRLKVGSQVRFVEEQGIKGAQASTVRAIGKRNPR